MKNPPNSTYVLAILALCASIATSHGAFQYYEFASGTMKAVQGVDPGPAANPRNAAFYNNAVFYFENNSNLLMETQFSYVGGDPATAVPFVTSINTYAVLGMSAFGVNTNEFGDISIHSGTGVLYGMTSRGRLYSVNLANPNVSFTEITPSAGNNQTEGLQIAFNHDNSILYGHHALSGSWYTIDTGSGALTEIAGLVTMGFTDLSRSGSGAVYGLDVNNELYEINVTSQTTTKVASFDATGGGIETGLAYSAGHGQLYFLQTETLTQVPEPAMPSLLLVGGIVSLAIVRRRG